MNVQKPILNKIRAFRGRIRACVFVEGLSVVALTVAGLSCVSLLFDYVQRPGLAGRVLSLAIGLAAIGVVLRRVLWLKLARPMDDERIALTVEDRFPDLRDRLISSLQFARVLESGADARSGRSQAMMSAVAADAAAAVAPLNLTATINHGRVLRTFALAVAAWGVVAAFGVLQPEAMKIWFLRNVALQDVNWPQRTHLVVTYKKVVPRGDALTVSVEAGGQLIPSSVSIRYEFLGTGRKGREKVARVGGRGEHRFETRFKNVVEPLRFRVSGGDAMTEWHEVALIERPAITVLKLQAVYPSYTGTPNAELTTSESYLDVLAGTTLWVRAIPSKTLQAARLVLDDGERTVDMMKAEAGPGTSDAGPGEPWKTREFWLTEEQRATLAADAAAGKCADELWIASLPVARDTSIAVRLLDTDGLDNRSPARFTIRTVADKAPMVTLKTTGIGQMVVPNATVPIEIKVIDDYGVKTLRLKHKLRMADEAKAEDEESIDFSLGKGGRTITRRMRWGLASAGLVTGSVLVFHAEAGDFKDVDPAQTGRSEELSLRVVTPEELLADLTRRQIDQRQDFVRIRDRQREEVKIELDAAARAGGKLGPDQAARLLGTEQTLRHSAEELKTVAGMCDQILQEMINNKLGDDTERSRLKDAIIGPTRRLAAELLPTLADGVRASVEAGDPGAGKRFAGLAEQNDRILKEMDQVLSNMQKMETYRRIVGQARKLREDQERLMEDIRKAHKELIESILDGVK